MSDNNKPLLAVFGATGGCANSCAALALKKGFRVRVLARTPSRLHEMLLSQEGISQKMLDNQLVVVKGDARDTSSVKETLLAESSNTSEGELADFIVFGVGGSPTMKLSLRNPVSLDNPSVCEESIQAISDSLQEIRLKETQLYKGPRLAVVSTTGISAGVDDVPYSLRWLYHYLLAVPHVDKRKMEQIVESACKEKLLSCGTAVRCSLLTGDHKLSERSASTALRAGTQEDPSIGYTVPRAAVGEWIFTNLLVKEPSPGFSIVTLTS